MREITITQSERADVLASIVLDLKQYASVPVLPVVLTYASMRSTAAKAFGEMEQYRVGVATILISREDVPPFAVGMGYMIPAQDLPLNGFLESLWGCKIFFSNKIEKGRGFLLSQGLSENLTTTKDIFDTLGQQIDLRLGPGSIHELELFREEAETENDLTTFGQLGNAVLKCGMIVDSFRKEDSEPEPIELSPGTYVLLLAYNAVTEEYMCILPSAKYAWIDADLLEVEIPLPGHEKGTEADG